MLHDLLSFLGTTAQAAGYATAVLLLVDQAVGLRRKLRKPVRRRRRRRAASRQRRPPGSPTPGGPA